MRVPSFAIYAFRDSKWLKIESSQLVPGDVVSLVRSTGDMVVPADVLLLTGSVVVNESLLTGESVPQIKEPVDTITNPTQPLSIHNHHKRAVVFGGTKLLLATTDAASTSTSSSSVPLPPDAGCVAYVLRTGFNTSQGELVRTILFATDRNSVSNSEAIFFILFLLIFAGNFHSHLLCSVSLA